MNPRLSCSGLRCGSVHGSLELTYHPRVSEESAQLQTARKDSAFTPVLTRRRYSFMSARGRECECVHM